jgi:hypothetical protein
MIQWLRLHREASSISADNKVPKQICVDWNKFANDHLRSMHIFERSVNEGFEVIGNECGGKGNLMSQH